MLLATTNSDFLTHLLKLLFFTTLAVRDSLAEPRGPDHTQQRASYFVAFPRFPINPSGESTQRSTPRTLPPSPPNLYRRQNSASLKPRILPVAVQPNPLSPDSPPAVLGHRRQLTPPKPTSRIVFSSTAKPRPLRLVEASLHDCKKRRPPFFYAQSSHTLLQSCTHITIHQQAQTNMASSQNPAMMPKVTPPLPSLPGTAVRPEGNKDRLLADLRRQVTWSLPLTSFSSSLILPSLSFPCQRSSAQHN